MFLFHSTLATRTHLHFVHLEVAWSGRHLPTTSRKNNSTCDIGNGASPRQSQFNQKQQSPARTKFQWALLLKDFSPHPHHLLEVGRNTFVGKGSEIWPYPCNIEQEIKHNRSGEVKQRHQILTMRKWQTWITTQVSELWSWCTSFLRMGLKASRNLLETASH